MILMKMELSKQYKKGSLENATWYYTSPDGVAMGVKTSQNDLEKTGLEANSIQDYAEAYTRVNIGTNKTVKRYYEDICHRHELRATQ